MAHDASRPLRIVIVGGGFGGAYCAQALEGRLRRLGDRARDRGVEVVLLDRNNYFVFSPLLLEAGTGSLEPRHAVVSIRAFLRRTRFIMGRVVSVDRQRREVSYRLGDEGEVRRLDYDHLVLAVGSVTRLPEVPGLAEHGLEMKGLADAVALRDRAIEKLELADAPTDPATRRRLLRFVVVGANFTGVEVAGELDVFLRRAARLYTSLHPDDVRVTLVELGERILPALDLELAEYARTTMERRGIEVRLATTVPRAGPDRVLLSDGETLETETVVWCAGIAPNPLVAEVGLPMDAHGYLLCDPDLRVRGEERVWAIGDSAVNLDADGEPYPATAQHAVRQGQHLARSLVRALSGEPVPPCRIRSRGALAALGCRTAVARVGGLKLSGFWAWFLWRTVYLLKMPGFKRRLRIALEWTIDLLFTRDPVQLGLARRRAPATGPPPPAPDRRPDHGGQRGHARASEAGVSL